jgi:hypothetical protein
LLRVNQLLNCFLVGGDADFFARGDSRFSRDLLTSLPPFVKKGQFLNEFLGRIFAFAHLLSGGHQTPPRLSRLT